MDELVKPILGDPKAILLVVLLLFPGFLWIRTERRYVPGIQMSWGEKALQYVGYSLLIYLFWWITVLPGLVEKTIGRQLSFWDIALWLLILFVSPIAGGIVSGSMGATDWLGSVTKFFGVPSAIDPALPTGWDKAFASQTPKFVVISMSGADGAIETVAGVLASKSSVSISERERDLFLEQKYVQGEGGEWAPLPVSAGIWIPNTSIRFIEIYDYQHMEGFRNVWQRLPIDAAWRLMQSWRDKRASAQRGSLEPSGHSSGA